MKTAIKRKKAVVPLVDLPDRFPNPFRPGSVITLNVRKRCHIRIKVYNLMGQKVDTITDGNYGPGVHSITWDHSRTRRGIYFYSLVAGNIYEYNDFILLKE